jgi:23S rRNA-/tRNA-specific pseudouridylate synthase
MISNLQHVEDAQHLVAASLEAAQYNKAHAASILNAFMGSFCLLENPLQGAKNAHFLLQAYDLLSVKNDNDNGIIVDDAAAVQKKKDTTTQKKHGRPLVTRTTPSIEMVPDLVTLSLAYQAFQRAAAATAVAVVPDEKDDCQKKNKTDPFAQWGESLLDRAIRLSKKHAGSKRRKDLAAAARRHRHYHKGSAQNQVGVTTCQAVEEELQRLLGDELKILHETDDFVVLNKPSGVSCFHKKSTTAGKIIRNNNNNNSSKHLSSNSSNNNKDNDVSLVDALCHCNISLSTLNPDALGVVHRLDRGTSGCMVLAKTNAMHAHLVAEFFLRRTTKHYLAIVAPAPSRTLPEEGLINIPVHGRPAKSKYRILKRYNDDDDNNNNINNNNNKDGNSSKDDYNSIPTWMMRMKTPTVNPTTTTTTTRNTCWDAALVQVELLTGRKHQIRVHCAQGLQCPVYGDPLYYGSSQNDSMDGKQRKNQKEDAKKRRRSSQMVPVFGSGIKTDRLLLHSHHLCIPALGIDVESLPLHWKKEE